MGSRPAPKLRSKGPDRWDEPSADPQGRVLIVSNRLPLTAVVRGNDVRLRRSSGGLATGLHGVHQRSGGLWIGWSGAASDVSPAIRGAIEKSMRAAGAVAISLDENELAGFYKRYSNSLLWPVLHGRQARGGEPDWPTYQAVNVRYANAVAEHALPGDSVWVHDYHLMLVPGLLRLRRPDLRIGFFLHTPFPEPAVFASLPDRAALLEGVLGADVIGFHTADYARRFVATVKECLPHATRDNEVTVHKRVVEVIACPMGVDAATFSAHGGAPAVAKEASRLRGAGPCRLLVGVDRLDPTKGIPRRLLAFERLLSIRPALRGRVRFIQVAVPSREDLPRYRETRTRVEEIVRRINERFGRPDWTPVEYVYGSVDVQALVALYRAADVMLVTPLCDGMNLVAKEFVASRVDGDGVLVLSDQAGAAVELRTALLVDPRALDHLVGAYESALAMSVGERRVRMRRLRHAVAANDVFHWASRFLDILRAPGNELNVATVVAQPTTA